MTEQTSPQNPPQNTQQEQPSGGQLVLHKIYIKDLSFEAPNSPRIFTEQLQTPPKTSHDVGVNVFNLGNNHYEVVVNVTVTVTVDGKTAFLAEAHQAGIFMLTQFPENQLQYMLFSYCANILFPYVRETVSDLVARGGFPQLLLEPVNFDDLFMRRVQQSQQKKTEDQEAAGSAPEAQAGNGA